MTGVREVSNQALTERLAADPRTHLFPLYVCRQAPAGRALVYERAGRIRAFVVDGRASRVWVVPGAWMIANDPADAAPLFAELARRGPCPQMDFPTIAEGAFREAFPDAPLRHDVYFQFVRPRPIPAATAECLELDPAALHALDIPDDLRSLIGNIDTLGDTGFFGAVEDGRLLAIADCIADVGTAATIQMVHTTSAARRRGLARAIVSHVCRHLVAQGKAVTYLTEERNHASRAVAQRCGFELLARFAFTPGPDSAD